MCPIHYIYGAVLVSTLLLTVGFNAAREVQVGREFRRYDARQRRAQARLVAERELARYHGL